MALKIKVQYDGPPVCLPAVDPPSPHASIIHILYMLQGSHAAAHARAAQPDSWRQGWSHRRPEPSPPQLPAEMLLADGATDRNNPPPPEEFVPPALSLDFDEFVYCVVGISSCDCTPHMRIELYQYATILLVSSTHGFSSSSTEGTRVCTVQRRECGKLYGMSDSHGSQHAVQ